MPEASGLEILSKVRRSEQFVHLPVIILTVLDNVQTKIKALELGATDFLNKPVDFVELAPRIRNALVFKAYHDQLKQRSEELQRQVELKTARLKESHAALLRANLVLRRSCEAAESAARAKNEFLANVSHELRTPLTAIIGFTETLLADDQDAALPPPSVEMLEIVLRNSKHLLQVVNDVLDIARVERGQLPIERVECAPEAILAEVARLLRPAAGAKGIDLVVETAQPLPQTILSDPMRLRQILINLIGNAVKFTEQGSVRVVTQLLEGDGFEPMLQVEVIDTGIGIDREQLTEIFKPFTQVRTPQGDKFSGTGLGLTICKYLARELGGQIQVESEPAMGSTFRVTIAAGPRHPRQPETEDGAATARQEAPAQARPSAALPLRLSGRILVAEDAPDNQRLIRLVLEKAGAEVTTASDGRAALEAAVNAWRRGAPFDVILTDIQMPVLDGYELVERLRGRDYRRPIVALTANATAEERRQCLAAGCDAYLSKPIDRGRLLSLLAEYLSDAASPKPQC
jgi:signal transduction histidine kinase